MILKPLFLDSLIQNDPETRLMKNDPEIIVLDNDQKWSWNPSSRTDWLKTILKPWFSDRLIKMILKTMIYGQFDQKWSWNPWFSDWYFYAVTDWRIIASELVYMN